MPNTNDFINDLPSPEYHWLNRAVGDFTSINLATLENNILLKQHVKYACDIGKVLTRLPIELATQENFINLIQHEEYASEISEAIGRLPQAFRTQEVFELLIKNTKEVRSFAILLNDLVAFGLYSLENATLITENCFGIGLGLKYLDDEHLVSQDYFLLLTQHPKEASDLARVIASLHKIGILTSVNQDLLIKNIEYVQGIEGAIHYIRPAGLSEKNYHLLIQHAPYAKEIFSILSFLPANCWTQENFETLIQCRGCLPEILTALKSLPRTGYSQAQANFNSVIKDMKELIQEEKRTFLSGSNKKFLEGTSPLHLFFHDKNLSDPNLTQEIFKFLPSS